LEKVPPIYLKKHLLLRKQNLGMLSTNTEFTVYLDGAKCQTLTQFLIEIAVVFKFPDYYGQNMNAFYDCINDLAWLDYDRIKLIVENTSLLMAKETTMSVDELKQILEEIRLEWQNVPNVEGEDEFRQKKAFSISYRT
jgi:RNAse (barnase) inhibitor barstar